MALTDLVLVKPIITTTVPGVGSTTTHGVSEERPVSQVLNGTVATVAGQNGTVVRTAAPADPASFADLTAAYNAWKAMRTALIAAGVFI